MLFGPSRFNQIERALPGISRSVLAARLRRLRRDGIIEKTDGAGYRFTPAGEALRPVVQALGEWVVDWILSEPTSAELDPELLMLFIS
ncbi:MAG TPA: winged helix-turn-helix transcriptional regulator, partial [Actinomycetes bacterium]|nr:winged helix-turn-helix transcriptional regulator [Actinomycetes bacterium]